MPIFGTNNLTLNQYLGSVNNSIHSIKYLGYTNLKNGRIVQFITVANSIGVSPDSDPRNEQQYLGPQSIRPNV